MPSYVTTYTTLLKSTKQTSTYTANKIGDKTLLWWRCASILLLPLVAICLETIDVCIWRMFVFMSVVVTVWGSVGMFVV